MSRMMSADNKQTSATTISFLSADRTAGGIQRALHDWAAVISENQTYALVLHTADTPALRDIAQTLEVPHRVLSNLQRHLYRFAPQFAAFTPKSDICFVHNGYLVPAARYLARRVIGVCHNDKPGKFKGADHLICLTPDGIDAAQKAGWKTTQLSCIPHFIETKATLQKPPHSEALHIISAGRLVAKKNFQLFIKMAAHAKATNANLRFSLAGTGPEADALHALNAKLGMPVEMLGWTDLNAIAAEADIFCSPSLDEPYGLVLTEMMQAGLAILASPTFGARLILDKGQVAPLLPFDDAKIWADQICVFDTDRQRLSDNQASCAKRLEHPIFSRARFTKDINALITS